MTVAGDTLDRGCSRSAVSQAISAGRITTTPGATGRRMINPDVADQEWDANTDIDQQSRGAPYQVDYSIQSEQRRLTKARADKMELELAVRRGELVSVADVSECWDRIVAAFRIRLLLLPHTAAPLIAAAERIPEVQAVLKKLIDETLIELAEDMVQNDFKSST